MFSSILVSLAVGLFWPEALVSNKAIVIFITYLLASVSAIAVFCACRWFRFDTAYLRQGNVKVLLLCALAALSSILPSARMVEMLPDSWTQDSMADVFMMLLDSPVGFIVLALLAPLVEEMVFRGTILRDLLRRVQDHTVGSTKGVWGAIMVSALLFAVVHMNLAQIPHAFIFGIFLGWLYAKTGSIVPGVVFHFVNNGLAYLQAKAFPELPYDAKVIDFFHGNEMSMGISVAVSIVVFALCLKLLNNLTTS